MLYLAHFRFGCPVDDTIGDFSFLAEAYTQEEVEMKLVRLLQGAVKNKHWFPAPCRIHLTRLAIVEQIPDSGLAFHLKLRTPGEYDADQFTMGYLPPSGVRVIYDWTKDRDWSKGPIPLVFVKSDRSLSFPTQYIPPKPW